MNGFYFIIQIDQKRSRIFVKGNEIIEYSFIVSILFFKYSKKRRKQKLYKRENHINLASINFRRDHLYHERVLDIRVKHNFFESWFIYPMEPTDPRNDRCSPIHKQLPVPGWIEIHPIIGEFDGL